ncbi:hypothetical protein KCP74_13150 [Salmonella enterica subsp. enterica]|nr:hypothetical protein KCP74_13150 [Salmonella enterica subsp. enterica]
MISTLVLPARRMSVWSTTQRTGSDYAGRIGIIADKWLRAGRAYMLYSCGLRRGVVRHHRCRSPDDAVMLVMRWRICQRLHYPMAFRTCLARSRSGIGNVISACARFGFV